MMRDDVVGSGEIAAIFGAAIQGRRRAQEDAFRSKWLAADRAWLLVLADGMGGHAAGDVASRMTVDSFIAAFADVRSAQRPLDEAFRSALERANSRLASAQKDSPELAGMGSTLVAAHLSPDGLAWISVGDSPLWLLRDGRLNRLNADHSLRAAVAAGAGTAGNLLLSALNGQAIELIDCHAEPLALQSRDLVMLASDGLLTLAESEIAASARQNAGRGPETIAGAILKAVEDRRKSNQDNCAIIVAAVP